jgi:branched-chain amino acid aminotransferase
VTKPEHLHIDAPSDRVNPYGLGCAWVGGRFVPIDDAAVPILDTGFVRSDLTYDVVSVWQGRFFRLEDHLDRLLRGCERLVLVPPLTRDEIRHTLIECVRRSRLREAYVEAIVTRGVPPRGERDPRTFSARFYAYAIPFVWIARPDQQVEGIDIVVARDTIRIPVGSVDPTVKNFHWGDLTRGLFEAYRRDAWLPVLTDGNGNITEGPGVNVFAVVDGRVCTPTRGVLEGITRRTVLEVARELDYETVVDFFAVSDLYRAAEVFLTSTAGGVMPVRSLDGVALGDGTPGPVTTRLRDRYWELHDDDRYATVVDYGAESSGDPAPGSPSQ